MNKSTRLFRVFIMLILLVGVMAPVLASGRLLQVGANLNLTQMTGQTLAPAGLAEEAVSWNSGVFESQQLLAVSWNSGISVTVSWNS